MLLSAESTAVVKATAASSPTTQSRSPRGSARICSRLTLS